MGINLLHCTVPSSIFTLLMGSSGIPRAEIKQLAASTMKFLIRTFLTVGVSAVTGLSGKRLASSPTKLELPSKVPYEDSFCVFYSQFLIENDSL